MQKIKDKIVTLLLSALLLCTSIWCIIKPPESYSESERRALQAFLEFSFDSVLSGDFLNKFDDYSMDQFPLRNELRTVKSASELYLFNKGANNDIYLSNGHISKIEYPLNTSMLEHATGRFQNIYDTYLNGSNCNIYLSIVPDKHYFLGKSNGYISIDYPALVDKIKQDMPYANYIDIFPLLSIDDYYRTDSHWRQENIVDVADTLAKSMGTSISSNYKINSIDSEFYGVYAKRLALPVSADKIQYLTNSAIDDYIVNSYDTGSPKPAHTYDIVAAYGKDAYEMFLCGSQSIIKIDNPHAKNDKELIIFRDSFSSSLAPLLAQGYSRITLVDLRYISSDILSNFLDFNDCDVLFIYSTTLLNDSLALK